MCRVGKFLFAKITSNRIVISKNIRTKVIGNETEKIKLVIKRNDECEISQNNFFK